MFSFDIPVKSFESDTELRRASKRRVVGLEAGQPAYRLLIVDGKWDNRRQLLELLAPLGFELQEAENGCQAIEIWESWQPHLIWMDLRLPEIDGYETDDVLGSAARWAVKQGLGVKIITGDRDLLQLVDDRILGAVLRQVYAGLLPRGRHPAAMVSLNLPPAAVDVNPGSSWY